MILLTLNRFRTRVRGVCPVFLLPVIFLSGSFLGRFIALVLVATLTPGTVTPGVSPTGGNPPLVLRDFPGAPAVRWVGRYAD